MAREPYVEDSRELVLSNGIVAHPLVYGELLMGDRGERQTFLENYRLYEWTPMVAHEEVVELVNARRLQGRGIGWIDAHLLASALAYHHRLWTADEPLATVASELGVGWTAPRVRE